MSDLDHVLEMLREAAAGLEDEPDCDIPDGPMVMLDDAEHIIRESWPQPASFCPTVMPDPSGVAAPNVMPIVSKASVTAEPATGGREEVTCPEPTAVSPPGSAESAATARPETTGAHTSPKPTGASSSSPGAPSAGRPSERAIPTDAPSSPTTPSTRAGGTGDGERAPAPAWVDELLESLEDMVRQHCDASHVSDFGNYDSMAISSNADAMRLLARAGRFMIDREHGRRVIGHFKEVTT